MAPARSHRLLLLVPAALLAAAGCIFKLERGEMIGRPPPDADVGIDADDDAAAADTDADADAGEGLDGEDGPSPIATWALTYGGVDVDGAHALLRTMDGGFLAAGYTASYGAGGKDVCLVKFDENAELQWQKAYGGTGDDVALRALEPMSGLYVVAGRTDSFSTDGGDDAFVMGVYSNGEVVWAQTWGEEGADEAVRGVHPVSDGYVLTGTKTGAEGQVRLWVVKTDEMAEFVWERMYSYDYSIKPNTVEVLEDGGILVAGSIEVSGRDDDGLLMKLDGNGTLLWTEVLGHEGDAEEKIFGVRATAGGGFVAAGHTTSLGLGDQNLWLFEMGSGGDPLWEKAYGGASQDVSLAAAPAASGEGTVVLGRTGSWGAGGRDVWLATVDAQGDISWEKAIGGTDDELGGSDLPGLHSLEEDGDGGYLAAGFTESYGAGGDDFLLLRIDGAGRIAGPCPAGFIRDSASVGADTHASGVSVDLVEAVPVYTELDVTLVVTDGTLSCFDLCGG